MDHIYTSHTTNLFMNAQKINKYIHIYTCTYIHTNIYIQSNTHKYIHIHDDEKQVTSRIDNRATAEYLQ